MNGQFDLGAINPLSYFFGIAISLGLLFAFIAPDNDVQIHSGLILLQWQLQSILPMALLILSHKLLHLNTRLDRLNPWFKLVLSGLLGALFFSPTSLLLDVAFGQQLVGEEQITAAWLDEFVNMAPPVIICWVLINAPWLLGYRLQFHTAAEIDDEVDKHSPSIQLLESKEEATQASRADQASQTERLPGFLALLPEVVRGNIIYMKAELHYLKVVTVKGHGLILYNLRDAMDEIQPDSGIQCHRSYWVSRQHILAVKKQGRQGVVTMSNGDHIPVSRRQLAGILAVADSK